MFFFSYARSALFLIFFILSITPIYSEEISSVRTKFRLLTPNDKITVEAFDDPKIEGITCYLSRAKKGGAASIIGFQEDSADASISCRQMGVIKIKQTFKQGEVVFKKSTSLVFKTMQVVRMFDAKRKAIIYLVYSNRIIEGSPKNAVTVVPIQDWNGIKADMKIMLPDKETDKKPK
ncbi:MAG: CreA protein [Alphaproteobacteria bacterium]|jgi:CreA protein